MDKKEIKDYLKRADELGAKLTGEDKETYAWLIYGYNQCAKLLNETEQQCKKQKEVIDKAVKYIDDLRDESAERQGFYNCFPNDLYIPDINKLLDILKEVTNNEYVY